MSALETEIEAAQRLLDAGELEAAIAAYRKLLELRPEDASLHRSLVSALYLAKKWDEAEAACRIHISLSPDEAFSYLVLGDLLERKSRMREAMDCYQRAGELAPDDARPVRRLARSFLASRGLGQLRGKPTCVYTAVFGDYDEIRPMVPQDIDCDYILFTDRPLKLGDSSLWRVVTINGTDLFPLPPRFAAKFFKTAAHRAFAFLSSFHGNMALHNYRQVVWIDASVRVTSPEFARLMISAISRNGLAMLKHPDRDCIYQEAQLSGLLGKYKGQPLEAQVAYYREQGYPEKNGLMAGTVFARELAPEVNAVFNDWWDENLRWSFQDQLSLPYVLWKHHRWFDVVDLKLRNNPLFKWEATKRRMVRMIS